MQPTIRPKRPSMEEGINGEKLTAKITYELKICFVIIFHDYNSKILNR